MNPSQKYHLNRVLPLLALLMTCPSASAQELSGEGERMQEAHRFLFQELIDGRNATLTGENPRHLRSVVLQTNTVEVSGELDLPLVGGAERVLPLFRYIELTGTGLDGLGDISLLPIDDQTALPVSAHTPAIYRVKVPALGVPSPDTPPFAIRLRGTGTVHSVSLGTFGGGISEVFDSAPYRNLGEELPPEKITIEIDLQHALSIDGHTKIDRKKWFRYYGVPNAVPRVMEDYAVERNFYPGRQIFKFEPALEKGYSPDHPKLKEDPKRPGWPDPTYFQRYKSDRYADVHEALTDVPFAMCFNDYPSFMSIEHSGRGTPKSEYFDAAAELVVQFLKNEIEHSGRTAEYWELKNESTIKAEWDYHFKKDVDSWGLLSQFHNTVADAVHQHIPGIKIGGPTSAWMQIQVNDFSLWNDQKRFMDETRGHMDFYSHHFYEDMGTLGAFEKRSSGYRNYLLGRLETILDMFQAHMRATGNVRPLLLTEYGSLNLGKSQADYWLRLRSYSAFLTRLMQRPEQIEFAVPFIFLASPWDPQNGHSVFVPKPEINKRDQLSGYRKTNANYFFELWRDFKGTRVPAKSPNPWLSIVAAHDGENLRLALSNMGGRRILANMNNISSPAPFSKVSQRRLHYRDGKINYHDAISRNISEAIPIDPEETTIVTMKLASPTGPTGVVKQLRWFAKQTVVRSNKIADRAFTVNMRQRDSAAEATLIIGIQRDGGLAAPLTGSFNGRAFKIDNRPYKNVPQLFESVSIDLPTSELSSENTIKLSPQSGLTITSVLMRTMHKVD